MPNQLIIADPGLISAAGHNAAALHALPDALGADRVACFAHQDIDNVLLPHMRH